MGEQQSDRILRRQEVMARVGLGCSTLYREMAAGRFPHPMQLSPGRAGWWESEINEWIANLHRRAIRVSDRVSAGDD